MKSGLLIVGLVLLAGCGKQHVAPQVPNLAGKCDAIASFDIDFNRFDETAQQIAHATGCFIQTDLAKTGAIKPHPVKGEMSRRQAIATAIEGTGLRITDNQPDMVVVE